MAWVRPKNKPKPRDPAQEADALRPILQFFSAGHTPKHVSRPRAPQQKLLTYYEEYDHESPPRRQHEIEEYDELEEVNPHAFSFSRDRLVPIVPKPAGRPKNSHGRSNHQPQTVERPAVHRTRDISPPSIHQPQIVERATTYRTRDVSPSLSPPSPPPPLSFKARVAAKSRASSARHHGAGDSSRTVSSRWTSATTPLDL